jgi:hypothetical protein
LKKILKGNVPTHNLSVIGKSTGRQADQKNVLDRRGPGRTRRLENSYPDQGRQRERGGLSPGPVEEKSKREADETGAQERKRSSRRTQSDVRSKLPAGRKACDFHHR